MGDHNSRTQSVNPKSYGESNDDPGDLMFAVLMRLCFDLNIHFRDLRTLRRRYEAEGFPFLTKTLPALGKALDQGLGSGHFKCPTNFRRTSHLPIFLGSLFKRVFDQETGQILPDICARSVRCVRQLCFLCYKAEMPYSEAEKERVLDNFRSTEEELAFERSFNEITSIANLFCQEVFNDFNWERTRPKDGPGVVSNMDEPYGKSEKKLSPIASVGERLGDFFFSPECLLDDVSRLSQRELRAIKLKRSLPRPGFNSWAKAGRLPCWSTFDYFRNGGTAKVILVPKDSRGPRLISCEPQENQYLQQGIMAYMVSKLESHWLTKSSVNFTDQSINQQAAKVASECQKYATLDLKDASDRVSMDLVRRIFQGLDLLGALELVRSPQTKLPGYAGGAILPLKKHAPMGSAVCFPVLASVIYFLGCSYLLTKGVDVEVLSSHLKVYGDDIIISTEYALGFIQVLEDHGLRVNRDKSFINSVFAESCGHDYVNGELVTPVRLKKVDLLRDLPLTNRDNFYLFNHRSRKDKWFVNRYALPRATSFRKRTWVHQNPYPTQVLLSLLESANLLRSKGLTHSSEFLFRYCESWLGVLPLGHPGSPYLCRWADQEELQFLPEANFMNPNIKWKSFLNQMTGEWEERMSAWHVVTRDQKADFTVQGHLLRVHRIWGSNVESPSPGTYKVPRGVEIGRGWYSEFEQYSQTVCSWLP